MEITLRSVVALTWACSPYLHKAGSGAIVFLGSILSNKLGKKLYVRENGLPTDNSPCETAHAGVSAYAAAKTGLMGFAAHALADFRQSNIKVTLKKQKQ